MELICEECKQLIKVNGEELYSVEKILGVYHARHYRCHKNRRENKVIHLTPETAKQLKDLLKRLYPYPKDTNFVWETINELTRVL